MNSQRGTALASPIGLVTKVESDALGRCWGGYMRLRVEVKVDEPLLRCVTVFSSKLQSTESYAVQYERLPIYCHSCGFIGHSTLVCATPAERDENDELPYSAKKLSVPDEKRSGGARSGNNASPIGWCFRRGSKGSTGFAAASGRGRGRGTKGGPATGEDQEVSSPVKGGRGRGRGRSARGRGRGSAAGELFPTMKTDKATSGQKRKATKATKHQSSQVLAIEQNQQAGSRALVIVSSHNAHEDSVEDDVQSSDSNKKLRTAPTRSADQAATATQSRQTQ
ncbi:hypothetical protein ZWY2020_054499 [Hordeum vulgare]|nr:hypothetical protein ZWY2020_054499 [Hordeum vulgare]